jgi:hypothetical protein
VRDFREICKTICKRGRLRDRGVETGSLLGWQVTKDV